MFKRKPKPQNINDLSNHHLVTALVANTAAQSEREKGTVVSQHLSEIAQRHLSISNVLDKMLEAAEKRLEI